MTVEKAKRPYRMQRRAESQEQTRLRITEAAVELHGSVGPALTSMSAVAERAGVRRSTLYRHFPDESALFDACTAHWAASNPLPDVGAWAAIRSPDKRLRAALAELYDFYGRTEQMLDNLFRDEPVSELVRERFVVLRRYFTEAQTTLLKGRKPKTAGVRAAIGHALAFATWKSLVREQGLAPEDAVSLMSELVATASGGGRGRNQL
jgi:AcrR family transcriptional regulator